jgi:hypothetical protein
VSIFNSDNTVCGVGWMPGSQPGVGVDDQSQGFSAVMRDCWYGATLAHMSWRFFTGLTVCTDIVP